MALAPRTNIVVINVLPIHVIIYPETSGAITATLANVATVVLAAVLHQVAPAMAVLAALGRTLPVARGSSNVLIVGAIRPERSIAAIAPPAGVSNVRAISVEGRCT